MKKSIEQIAKEDGRFDSQAFKFVHEGLGITVEKILEQSKTEFAPRHITGRQLSEGLAKLAAKRWGRLAKLVLNEWGVFTTKDFGEIVYRMIENGWMSAQQSDSIEDFNGLFDFEQVFEKKIRFEKMPAD